MRAGGGVPVLKLMVVLLILKSSCKQRTVEASYRVNITNAANHRKILVIFILPYVRHGLRVLPVPPRVTLSLGEVNFDVSCNVYKLMDNGVLYYRRFPAYTSRRSSTNDYILENCAEQTCSYRVDATEIIFYNPVSGQDIKSYRFSAVPSIAQYCLENPRYNLDPQRMRELFQ